MNFLPNFNGKLRSSLQVKFASFGVVGVIIELQMNLNNDLIGTGTPHHRQMTQLASGYSRNVNTKVQKHTISRLM